MHNLSPEEKKIGKDNFHSAVGSTRRDFLKQSVLTTVVAGGGAGAMYFNYGETVGGSPVRVGIIGTGDEGNVLIGAINPDYVQVVAIADIRPYNVWRAFNGDWSSDSTRAVRPGLEQVYGWTPAQARENVRVFENGYEELLAAKDELDLEGVIVALPLHLHAEASIKVMRAGLHVLTEKLMGHSVKQCKEMARVSKETELLLATGHQRHYSILYDNAVHTIREGLLGDVHHIRAQWHRGNLPGRDSWKPPLPEPREMEYKDYKALLDQMSRKDASQKHPLFDKLHSWKGAYKKAKGKEKELWGKRVDQLERQIADYVDAEEYGYQSKTINGLERSALEELVRWRLWDRTGGGLMAELGSHQLDAASIFISSQRDDGEKVLPLSVMAMGGRHIFPHDRECNDHVYCMFEYPGVGYYEDFATGKVADPNKKIVVTYSSINGNGFGGYGETVLGTKGTLILEREKEVMLYAGSNTTSNVKVSSSSSGPTLDTTESGGGAAAAVASAAMSGPISRGYREEIEHWAWCIRNPGDADNPNLPRCHPKVALADAVIALTTNLAMEQGKPIEFQESWFDIDSDETPEGDAPRKAADIAADTV